MKTVCGKTFAEHDKWVLAIISHVFSADCSCKRWEALPTFVSLAQIRSYLMYWKETSENIESVISSSKGNGLKTFLSTWSTHIAAKTAIMFSDISAIFNLPPFLCVGHFADLSQVDFVKVLSDIPERIPAIVSSALLARNTQKHIYSKSGIADPDASFEGVDAWQVVLEFPKDSFSRLFRIDLSMLIFALGDEEDLSDSPKTYSIKSVTNIPHDVCLSRVSANEELYLVAFLNTEKLSGTTMTQTAAATELQRLFTILSDVFSLNVSFSYLSYLSSSFGYALN